MKHINNYIKLSAIISYGVIIFSIIAGLIYTPWMVSKIGKEDYGLYILVTSFLAYFVVDYGMWQSINKLISQYRAEGNQEKIEKTIGVATKIYLALDIIVCIVLFFVYFFIDSFFKNLTSDSLIKFKTIFLLGAIFSVLNFPFSFVRGIMFAYEYLIQSRYFELGAKIALILSTVVILSIGGGLYWLVLVYGLVPLIKNILISVFLYKKGVRMNIKFWSREVAISIIGVSVWLFLYVAAELFINNISPSIIVSKSSLDQVAIFAIGMTLYGYTYQISNSIAGLFLPEVTRMRHAGLNTKIDDFSLKLGRIQLMISGFIIFGIIASGSLFINAWMGESFADSYYVASLMVIPGLVIYPQQIEESLLLVNGKFAYRSLLMMLTAGMSIFLSFLLVPQYGAIGAAIAISTANLIFMAVSMSFVYKKMVGFNLKRFYRMLFKFTSVFILVGICVKLFQLLVFESYYSMLNKWVSFIIISAVYTTLFCAFTFFFLLNNYEKSLIKSSINKINRKLLKYVQR